MSPLPLTWIVCAVASPLRFVRLYRLSRAFGDDCRESLRFAWLLTRTW